MIVSAPAKLNLCLFLGETREDGLHDLVSVFSPLDLTDRLEVTEVQSADEVSVPAIEDAGPDLTARALAGLRDAGWDGSPVRIGVDKRIPVAAGLGGGSADAAAVLRLAHGDLDEEVLRGIAAALGADVTSQLEPSFCLVAGSGGEVEELPEPEPFGVVLIADPDGLSTPAVYAEADRLGLSRGRAELDSRRAELVAATREGAHPLDWAELMVNDLGAAAALLRPEIADRLEALRAAGAGHALVTGSGPTAAGICRDAAHAAEVAARLAIAAELRTIVCEGGRA